MSPGESSTPASAPGRGHDPKALAVDPAPEHDEEVVRARTQWTAQERLAQERIDADLKKAHLAAEADKAAENRKWWTDTLRLVFDWAKEARLTRWAATVIIAGIIGFVIIIGLFWGSGAQFKGGGITFAVDKPGVHNDKSADPAPDKP